MRLRPERELLHYGIAVLSVGVVLVAKLALDNLFVEMRESPFLLTFGAIMVSAWYGGRGPGLLATALAGITSDYFFLEPRHSFFGNSTESNIKLCLFLVEGTLISFLGGALHESRARTSAILDTATDGVITMDHDGRIVEFNSAAEKIFGLRRTEAVGQDMAELIIPERLRELHQTALQKYLATGEGPVLGRRIELPALRADGSEFPVELAINRLPSEGPPLFTGFVRDISDRKEAARHIEEARMYAESIVDSVREPLVILDTQLRVMSASRSYYDTFGGAPRDTEFRYLYELGDRQWNLAELRSRLQEIVPRNATLNDFEVEQSFPTIGRRTMLLNARRIQRENIPAGLILLAIEDVTDRKQAERRLHEATQAAEAANQAKSEFLANVSHELRTPMNAVLGMLQLTLGEKLTPVTRDYLGTAKDSAESLMFLLNDLLDFSRIEAGRFELETAFFSLRDTLDATMKTLALRAHEKKLELSCHVAADVPDGLLGDRNRLRQVILNLVGNAIKFTEQGEIIVDVTVDSVMRVVPATGEMLATKGTVLPLPEEFLEPESVDQESGERNQAKTIDETLTSAEIVLHFIVTDTGIGIAPEQQERIFAPFTQVDASSTRTHQGAGLGLAICRELVERMGGNIWVESEPGRGSRFHATARFQIETAESTAALSGQALLTDLSGLPVLIVDDNPTNCRILEEMLTGWAMQPTSAGDSQTALELLRNAAANDCDFSIVLLDALMPDVEGAPLVEQIRKNSSLDVAIIVMLSSADRQTIGRRLQNLDIAASLEKPISELDLLDTILLALKEPLSGDTTMEQVAGIPRRLRVLVAEDTPANQKVVRAILANRGHTVEIAQNGREAVQRVQQDHFDVVLMDVQMPMMDGLQATAAIRQLASQAQADVPIVAMTAHALPSDRERFLAAGMNDYLAKPIDADKLTYLVERLAASSRPPANNRGDREDEDDTAMIPEDSDEPSRSQSPAKLGNNEVALVDRTAALKRLGGNVHLFQSLARFFDEDAPELLDEIRTGLRSGDAEQVTRAAHSLKGLAANFGCEEALTAAARMQEIGQSGDLGQAAEGLATLAEAIGRLNAALAPDRASGS